MASKKITRPSEPDAVDAYLAKLKHPLAEFAGKVRRVILATDRSIGEEVKWNAPAFFYTGPMETFDPKEYRRHLIVFNFYKKGALRLVFWRGDRANDKTGFLEGKYPDGRRLATLSTVSDLTKHKKALQAALKAQLKHMKGEN